MAQTAQGQSPLPYSNNNFQSQQHLAKRYTKVGIIGRGTFGTVYRGVDNEDANKKEVAIKVMDLESIEDDINNIMQEIIALRDCQSEHVPKYYHSFNIGPELWIVMEFMGGGSVHDYLDPKEQLGLESENLIAIILREVLKGLAYLHSLKMIHRDIKAANILLSDDGHVKLADFGVVGRLTETIEKRMTMIGSPYWMAPEVIVPEKGKDDGYGTQADIWSLGILGIEMANGIPPHGDQHPFEAMRRIMEGPPPKLEDSADIEWSDNFKNFLSKCLEKDPKKRPSANELLKHNFFKDCGELSDLKEDLIDAMKEYDTYDGDIEYYNEDDQKYGSVIYSDTTGTTDNLGTLNILNDGDAAVNALTNDPTSIVSVGSDDMNETTAQHAIQSQSMSGSGSGSGSIPTHSQTQSQSQASQIGQKQMKQQLLTGSALPRTSLKINSSGSNANSNTKNKLKKGQYSQSSRHIMVGGNSIGGAFPGPRHSRQFSKRKSTAQAAAIRAHRKLQKQKSYNMSIEWTYSTRASLNMLQVPIGSDAAITPTSPVDLYDDSPANSPPTHNQNNSNKIRKIKSKSIGNPTNATKNATSPNDDPMSDSGADFEFDGGTMVRSDGGRTISLDKTNGKPTVGRQISVACYDIGIQTEHITRFEKGVQTDTHTVAHLVGIRKEILAICENMDGELSTKGKEHLEQLKQKIREMTHLKITERRMKSLLNVEDTQEAQRRKDQIRANSAQLDSHGMESTQARLKDLRTKLDARTNSKHGKM